MGNHSGFRVADRTIHSPLILAPMDGLTDYPLREIIKDFHPGIIYSEFINAIDFKNNHPHLEKIVKFSEDQRPFTYQIFDNSPDRILETALWLERFEPDFIDINLGCSARTIANRGAGAGLLKEPKIIKEIFFTLSRKLSIPVTAKMRLGWDENSLNYLEIAATLEEAGCQMIAVHARTKKQGYLGLPDWQAVAEIKKHASIPILANGNIETSNDIQKVKKITGCDGFMIGRGAIRNPWIFRGKALDQVHFEDRVQLIRNHIFLMADFYGKEQGLKLFRKYIKYYIRVENLEKEDRQNVYNIHEPIPLSEKIAEILFHQIHGN